MTAEPLPLSRRLFPGGWLERSWFLWVTVVVPAVAFLLSRKSANVAAAMPFQRQDPAIWTDLLLGRSGSGPFLPLAVLIMAVCTGVALKPGSWVLTWPVRTVLALGAAFSLHFAARSRCWTRPGSACR